MSTAAWWAALQHGSIFDSRAEWKVQFGSRINRLCREVKINKWESDRPGRAATAGKQQGSRMQAAGQRQRSNREQDNEPRDGQGGCGKAAAHLVGHDAAD